jgi:hypothetical protein
MFQKRSKNVPKTYQPLFKNEHKTYQQNVPTKRTNETYQRNVSTKRSNLYLKTNTNPSKTNAKDGKIAGFSFFRFDCENGRALFYFTRMADGRSLFRFITPQIYALYECFGIQCIIYPTTKQKHTQPQIRIRKNDTVKAGNFCRQSLF